MPQVINPSTIIKVVPRDGELEITLNVNITLDGKVLAASEQAKVTTISKKDDDEVTPLIPSFSSGKKILNFNRETD